MVHTASGPTVDDEMIEQYPWHAPLPKGDPNADKNATYDEMKGHGGELDSSWSHPFRSPRITAASKARDDDINVASDDLSYAAAREHGLAQGYHLFRAPPPPIPSVDNRSAWYVNNATLRSAHGPAAYDLNDDQLRKRKMHVKALMRHDPAAELKEQKMAMRRAVEALDEVDSTLPADCDALVSATQALKFEFEKFQKSKNASLKEQLVSGLPLHEAATEEARAKAEVQSLLRSDLYDVTSELADKWAALQREGEAARRSALEKMVSKGANIHEQMVDVELRLTDHVLLGTAEEAERMLRAPGPDGAQLRQLRQEGDELIERQRKQKAVLVHVARKALESDAAHREEIAAFGRRLLAADKTHDQLLGAADALKALCTEVRSALGAPLPTLKKRAEPASASAAFPKSGGETMLGRGTPASSWQKLDVSLSLTQPTMGVAFARDELPTASIDGSSVDLSKGLLVVRVAPDGAAFGKLSTGDVVLSVNGTDTARLSGYPDLSALIMSLPMPSMVGLQVARAGAASSAKAPSAAAPKKKSGGGGGWFGFGSKKK